MFQMTGKAMGSDREQEEGQNLVARGRTVREGKQDCEGREDCEGRQHCHGLWGGAWVEELTGPLFLDNSGLDRSHSRWRTDTQRQKGGKNLDKNMCQYVKPRESKDCWRQICRGFV